MVFNLPESINIFGPPGFWFKFVIASDLFGIVGNCCCE